MTAGGILSIIIILFGVFFVVYKRKMLIEVFSLNMQTATVEFQEQLEAVGADVVGQLEEKMSHLEFLLAEAEDRNLQLEEKLAAAERVLHNVDQRMATLSAVSSAATPQPTALQPKLSEWQASETFSVAASAERDAESVNEVAASQETPEMGDRRKLILTMAEQGYNVTEIAKATGVGKGEIMLLLQLHRK